MALIKWRDELKVGIEEIDEDHRALIDLINALYDVMQLGADQVQVVGLLGEIYTQIASHFALEEKLMREMRYGDYVIHKEDHDTLLDELREIMDEVEDDGSFDAVQLSSDLNRWFSDHFAEFDARLHRTR